MTLLLPILILASAELPPMPKSIVQPPAQWHFAATASNCYGTSDYSNDVATTNARPTLAWNRSSGADYYAIFRGHAAGRYSQSFFAGSNTTLAIPAPAPGPSNLVVTVRGPTGLLACVTNPTGSHYWTGHLYKISSKRS